MDLNTNRKFTDEEKQQLIANLDIEVAHRTRQFKSWLADRLENFGIHQEGHVSRIPKQVRTMSMREFGDKYNGNIQAALRGFQKEKLVASGGEGSLGEIDKSTRKRKWVASQEADNESSGSGASKDTEALRSVKNVTTGMTPKKKPGSSTGPGTAQRARMLATGNKTPSTIRTLSRIPASPSPQKFRPPFNNNTSSIYAPRPPVQPTSPSKHPTTRPSQTTQRQRVPSSATFNPMLPPKTPMYPTNGLGPNGAPTMMRLPRRDESMLSVNGSPIANPYELGMGWFKGLEMEDQGCDSDEDHDGTDSNGAKVNGLGEPRKLKRMKSNIIIRRDPSVAYASASSTAHSRANSQSNFLTSSSQPTNSRDNSHPSQNHLQPQSLYPALPQSHSQPLPGQTYSNGDSTPKRHPIQHSRSFSALVAIPTKDGHLLEFDPLQTSPGSLDALEGITDSAKKEAKVEMGRLVQAAVDKWKIG